jgi:F-type H+-transporting ATPase subunit delta
MNTGISSSRYATALLRYVDETGNGQAVYDQILQILKDPDSMPRRLEPDLARFVKLLVKNKRMEYVKQIFHRYMEMYNASRGRRLVTLKTAVPAPDLCKQVKDMLQQRLGGEVLLDAEVDPSLIGGFVLIIDDKLLDASVSRQLEEIRRQYMDKNKRIV